MKVVSISSLRRKNATPYNRTPYRPSVRAKIDSTPIWRLQFDQGRPLLKGDMRCDVAEKWDAFPGRWTMRKELDAMRHIEAEMSLDRSSTPTAPLNSPRPTTQDNTRCSPSHVTESAGFDELAPACTGSGGTVASEGTESIGGGGILDSSSCPADKMQHIKYTIRGLGLSITCLRSRSAQAIGYPKVDIPTQSGDVYMHQSPSHPQIWVKGDGDQWVEAHIGMPHPRLSKHCLNISVDGWARWVQKKTVSTYRGKAKQHSTNSF